MKSLQEICLTASTLEEYLVDVLALVLLPKAIREEMLHNLPIVDICRLDDTQFTSGIDSHMDHIWEKLYQDHMELEELPSDSSNWRQCYLQQVSSAIIILEYGRPYRRRWYLSACLLISVAYC